MLQRTAAFFCLCLSGLAIAVPVLGETISIRADPWLPYNGLGAKGPAGYMVDAATLIAKKHGHVVDYADLPWNDAKEAVRKGEYDCIVGAARGDAEDFHFPSAPWGKSQNAFYGLAQSQWRFDGMKSLESIRLAVIDGYSYTDELDRYIEAHRNDGKIVVIGGIRRAAMTAVSQLVAAEADVFVEDINVMQQTLDTLQMRDRVIHLGALDQRSDVYIACTPAHERGKQLAQMFSDGLIELRKTGELKEILDRYGLKDWE